MLEPAQIAALDAGHLATLLEQSLVRLASEMRGDFRSAMAVACQREAASRPQVVLRMLEDNAQLASAKALPLCQDTGTVWVLLEIGSNAYGQPLTVAADIFSQVDTAVGRAWELAALRPSLLQDALVSRLNTGDNSPAFCDLSMRPQMLGARLHIMLKGGGTDNASSQAMLAPGDGWPGVRRFVVEAVRSKAANACPPLLVGVGIGSTFDKVAALSKHALLREVGAANPCSELDCYEAELLAEINATGIGPGGLGGQTTALAVHLESAPCHIAALPVAVNLCCNAIRTVSFDLTGHWLEGGGQA
ncbi:MAG: fumarate hydratase [Actinomycetia bacterium]|nr:fumarate hydratase [Actinomycetes bacterium]